MLRLLLLLLFSTPLLANSPTVVVSIKPYHSLVAAVMEGKGEPLLLVDGSFSPHTYSLKPRDASALQRADLIIWGGESSEPFLEKALHSLAHNSKVIDLMQLPSLHRLPIRGTQLWETEGKHVEDRHDDHEEEEEEHHHPTHGIDPHIWLTPENAMVITQAAVTALSEIDPAASQHYQENGAKLIQQLQQLDQQLAQRLYPLREYPFIVFHDSYQYMEARYGLQTLGAVTRHVEHGSSVKAITAVREQIRQHKVRCLFKEPQFSSRMAQIAVEGSAAQIGVLDPLGANLIPGPKLYFQLMENLSHSLRQCLQ